MARRRKSFEYESPIPDDELSRRMSSSAGRKLEERLKSVGWTDERHPPVINLTMPDPATPASAPAPSRRQDSV